MKAQTRKTHSQDRTDLLEIPDFLKMTPAREKAIRSAPAPRHQLGTRTANEIKVTPPGERPRTPSRNSRYVPTGDGGYRDDRTGQTFLDWPAVVQSWGIKTDSGKTTASEVRRAVKRGEKRAEKKTTLAPEKSPPPKKSAPKAPRVDIEELLRQARKLGYKEDPSWPNGGVRVMRARNFILNHGKKV